MSGNIIRTKLIIVTGHPFCATENGSDVISSAETVYRSDANLCFYECAHEGNLPDHVELRGRVFHRCCEEYYLDNTEKRIVGPFFDHLSTSYETAFSEKKSVESYKWVFAGVLDNSKENHGWILDLGAGHGSGVKAYQEIPHRKLRLAALDMSQKMLGRCSKASERIEGTAEALPVDDECLCGVVAVYVLHYLCNPENVFREIARTLVPKGIFSFVTYRHDPNNRLYRRILKATGFAIIEYERCSYEPPEHRAIAARL